ncbi:MAG TPA: ABC transporter transmembrane domain-containing protein [Candidatus Binatia bacterium]|nr:ABC transporter transmembrane domain-containing protein [Candidatus Binatia bacterium]
MKTYRRLLPFLKPYIWPYFALGIVCMLGYSATDGVIPFLVRSVFDDLFQKKNPTMLRYVPLAIIVVFSARGLLNFGQHYFSDYVGLRIINDVRNRLNCHLQYLSLAFFYRHPTGTLLSRVGNDVTLLRAVLTDALASLVRDSLSVIVLIGVAFYQDWVLASIAFFVFPASVLPVMRMSRKIKRFTKRGQISTGNLTALLQESVQGNRIVKAFGMEEYEIKRFTAENFRLFKQSVRASRIKAVVTPTMEFLASFGIAGVVWYGGWSVIGGDRTQGEFMAFMAAMMLMYQPFKSLARTYAAVQQGIAGAERVFEILDTHADVQERPGARAAKRFTESIEFHDVSFGYGEKLVLKDINLRICAGEMVALVGISGVGKSTMADLIPRFYDVTGGAVTMDNIDIRDLTLRTLRQQIGLVSQHTFLFNDTIRNNISYGDPERSMDDIMAAAKAAYAHDFIMSLPRGYDTNIGEMGLQLSGGQRQRLAIARALLKDAPILILDEATSALDAQSERSVQNALDNLMTRRTTVVVAHRLSTIRRADRIVVLVGGKIAEQGRHEELMARKQEYSRLYSMQLLEDVQPVEPKIMH